MNKILAGILAVSMTAGLVSAQEPVLSRNAVGYVKVNIPANGDLVIVSTPFDTLDGTPVTFTNAVGNQLPSGSIAVFFNPVTQTYQSSVKGAKGWSGVGATKELEPGESFFVRQTNAAPFEVILMGQVPDEESLGFNLSGGGALTMVAYPFPAPIAFTETALAASLANNDAVIFFNSDSQTYASRIKGAKGWSGAANTLVPGEGFFVRKNSVGAIDWSETKPYTWP